MIHLAGQQAGEIVQTIFRPLPSHRQAGPDVLQLGRLMDDSHVLDEAVVCQGPQGAEINIHGGPHVVRRVLELLAAQGASIAEAPAVDDLPLAHPKWNNPAIGRELLAALPNARSSFVVSVLSNQWSGGLSELACRDKPSPAALRAAAEGLPVSQRLLNPPEVVLAGPPNAGKSCLANALIGRPVSIVHEQAGTTRDWVREPALLDGVPIWLTDTAGLWEAPDAVDAEAVRRAHQRIHQADLILLLGQTGHGPCVSAPKPGSVPGSPKGCRGHGVCDHADHEPAFLVVASQCDRVKPGGDYDVAVSAVTGEGLAELRAAMRQALGLGGIDPASPRAFTQRHAERLRNAAEAFERRSVAEAREELQALLG